MHKKLTITVDEEIYAGLHAVVGRGNISRLFADFARRHIRSKLKQKEKWPTPAELEAGYRAMAADEQYMTEAFEWVESNIDDGLKDMPDATW